MNQEAFRKDDILAVLAQSDGDLWFARCLADVCPATPSWEVQWLDVLEVKLNTRTYCAIQSWDFVWRDVIVENVTDKMTQKNTNLWHLEQSAFDDLLQSTEEPALEEERSDCTHTDQLVITTEVAQAILDKCQVARSQLRLCRGALQSTLFSALLKLEHKVVKGLCSKLSVVKTFALVLLWRVGSMLCVRFISFGFLEALPNLLMQHMTTHNTQIIPDCAATIHDVEMVRCTKHSTRAADVQQVIEAFTTFSSNGLTVQANMSGCFCWQGSQGAVVHSQFGSELANVNLEGMVTQLAEKPLAQGWDLQHLTTYLTAPSFVGHPTTIPIDEQFRLLNALPAQNVGYTYKSGSVSVFEAWPSSSLKSMVISEFCPVTMVTSLATQHFPSVKPHHRTSKRKRQPRMGTACAVGRQIASLVATAAMQASLNGIASTTATTSITISLLAQTQQQLLQCGLLCPFWSSESVLQVVWNKFDPTKGCLVQDEFVSTTMQLTDDLDVMDVSCVGCPSFMDSLLCCSELDAIKSGWCVHTAMLPVVCKVAMRLKDHERQSFGITAFERFVETQCEQQQPRIVQLRNRGNTTTYFIFADKEACHQSNTPRHAVCLITKTPTNVVVHCREVRCRRGKHKGLKNVQALADLCPHLTCLVTHLQLDDELTFEHQDDEEVDTDTADIENAAGIQFDVVRNMWIPWPGISTTPIPQHLPEAAAAFARDRLQLRQWPDCAPSLDAECDNCKLPWSEAVQQDAGTFLLHTYVGAITRRMVRLVCVCGAVRSWDPASEFIHAISATEGGGWEIVFDFLHHIVGEAGQYAGVPMHLGHFRDHVNAKIQTLNPEAQPFFSALAWRKFVQSALALRMQSLPKCTREPCCGLRFVGGDGTGIGVPLHALSASVTPVWNPPEGTRERARKWGRLDRCGISAKKKTEAAAAADARQFVKELLSHTTSAESKGTLRQDFHIHSKHIPEPVVVALQHWLVLSESAPHWESLRTLLRAISYQDSLSGIITLNIATHVAAAVDLIKSKKTADLPPLLQVIRQEGMGPDVETVLKNCYALDVKARVFLAFLEHITTRVQTMFKGFQHPQPPESSWLPRPDPSATGIRYMLTEHGKSVRGSWPLTDDAEKALDSTVGSSDGCKKIRTTYVGHRQRSGMWVYMCMEHQTIVGFHVMAHGEGRRDAIFPLYRFLETPPKAIFGDYVCGIEETALNLLPEFFQNVQFFHDLFHGVAHSCSPRFLGRRLSNFASLNTSLMEQMNSFLQPLRGLVKSPTTKLATLMFWTEVFTSEWNTRKQKTHEQIRCYTLKAMTEALGT